MLNNNDKHELPSWIVSISSLVVDRSEGAGGLRCASWNICIETNYPIKQPLIKNLKSI